LSQLGDLRAFQWIEQLIHGMVFFSPGVAVTSQCAATKRKKAVNLEKVGILVFFTLISCTTFSSSLPLK
jgi:hypothetical protein